MICVEYALCKQKYKDALVVYQEILDEQEELFNMTQPKSMRYDQDRVQSTPSNMYEKYVQKKAEKKIDERLESAKALISERKYVLELKKEELINSKEIPDIIYRYKNIEAISIDHIAEMMGYSKRQIKRKLEKIDSIIIKMSTNVQKCPQMSTNVQKCPKMSLNKSLDMC